ncbi:hypothetical protein SeLEV6574_g07734 [Synchytrium endobioticum]|uniref:FHA domain-containing protein n=1 Tax=Synchytrium endobioticum TaxID=286115 RepID=A0A507CK05_9FUNG|nr:hypothetical protein SeLEV6574_g07734 [Synchytrium endobioticum]
MSSARDYGHRPPRHDSLYKRKRSPSPPPPPPSSDRQRDHSNRHHSQPTSPKDRHTRDRPTPSSRNDYHDQGRAHHTSDYQDAREKTARDAARPTGAPVRGVHAQRNEDDEERAEAPVAAPKEKPNYQPSGKLAAEQNTYKGVVLKYSEPPEARKTVKKWRLYVFKGKEQVDLLHVHRQSAYLVGRERLVADIPIDHPSCSKQHAVLQYRQVSETNDLGDSSRVIKPYLIDLESANGSFLNGGKIEASRYYELKAGDTIKFGFSSRDYVILPDDAAS